MNAICRSELRIARVRVCAAALTLCGAAASAAPFEEIVRLPSEGGAVSPYLRSWDDGREVKVAAVLFTGGGGSVGLQRGIPKPGANFLVRSRKLFLEQGIATAVIDVPSDVGSMSDGFRSSARHARDVAAVLADLKQRFAGVRVFLVGTSRGTVSAAHAAAALGSEVAGVALTSSVFKSSRGGGAGLMGFDYASIASSVLLVHHVDDACPATPYWEAKSLSKKYPLVSVSGGDPARSDPCEPFSAHGYLGREAPTVSAISRWMLGLEFARTIP